MASDGQFRPPGKLKLLFMFLGDRLFEFLIGLGWQPKGERNSGKGNDTR